MTKSLADKLSKQPTVAEELAAHQEKTVTRATKEKYKAALAEIQRLEKEAAVLDAIRHVPRPILPQGPRKATKGARATALLLLSDWHVEEPVIAREVNGLNSYDLSIAESSVKTVFERFLVLLENARGMATIENLLVWCGGDLLSGDIHEELAENALLSPCEAVLFVEELLEWGLRYLAKFSGAKSIGIVTSVGNHGRTKKKMPYSGAHRHSYEWLSYKHTAMRLRDDKIFGWNIGEAYHTWQEVEGGHLLRFHHGDAIKYKQGVGGLAVPVNQAQNGWNVGLKRPPLFDCFGHLHQWTPNNRWNCNGSVIGYNAYAMKNKLPFEEPCQSMVVVDSKRGVTRCEKVFCR
jgi:hypothetical protein